jgi:hypothetical protein
MWFWLSYWRIDRAFQYFEETSTADENYYAAVGVCWNEGLCKLYLCTEWDVKPTNALLDKSAFHESLHVLLAPMDHKKPEDADFGNEHMIIRTLENTFLPQISEYQRGNY